MTKQNAVTVWCWQRQLPIVLWSSGLGLECFRYDFRRNMLDLDHFVS